MGPASQPHCTNSTERMVSVPWRPERPAYRHVPVAPRRKDVARAGVPDYRQVPQRVKCRQLPSTAGFIVGVVGLTLRGGTDEVVEEAEQVGRRPLRGVRNGVDVHAFAGGGDGDRSGGGAVWGRRTVRGRGGAARGRCASWDPSLSRLLRIGHRVGVAHGSLRQGSVARSARWRNAAGLG